MKAMIPGRKFELRKAQVAVPLAAIRAAIIRVVAVPAAAVREGIPQRVDPTARTPAKILKTTPKSSR